MAVRIELFCIIVAGAFVISRMILNTMQSIDRAQGQYEPDENYGFFNLLKLAFREWKRDTGNYWRGILKKDKKF